MIGIVSVNYNQYRQTDEFLKSFNLIKNADNALLYLANLSSIKKPIITKGLRYKVIIEAKDNKGYAFGVNCGLKYLLKMDLDKFCVVNNDVFFDKNFLIEVEKTFENCDIFGGKIYYAPGFEYHKNRYRKNDLGKILWYAGGYFDWKNCFAYHRGVDEVDCGQYDKFAETEFITGCLFCFNKKVVNQIGWWDESYFLYYEDADYCIRAKRVGFKLYYNPKIIIYHKNAQSTGGSGSKIHQQYQEKNRLIFGLKYAPLLTKFHLLKNYFLKKI